MSYTTRSVLLGLIVLLLALPAPAQNNRGTAPTQDTGIAGQRRALVVGISRYANLPPSQQLEYADADAEMVYAFLQSAVGGPTDEAVLLRDEEATAARIIAELTRLRQAAEEGDEVIFYFAGHGDVERITENTKRGRLLAYDAPASQNYVGNGGTIPIQTLRDVMEEVVDQGARAFILTDACRAGSVNDDMGTGAALTSAVLAADWSRVFRFVSSNANQLSQEDPNLGHGVFTYYLLNGLLGAADGLVTEDERVDHTELQLYVTQQVARTTGSRQSPVLSGDPQRPLALVSSDVTWQTLESLVPERSEAPRYRLLAELSAEDRATRLDALSPRSQALTEQLERALQEGRLLDDDGAAALYESLRGQIPSTYFVRFGDLLATALEDQAQATLSTFVSADALLSAAPTATETSAEGAEDRDRGEKDEDGGGKAQNESSIFSLPTVEIERAAQAMAMAQELRGATYATYPSIRSRAQFLRGLVQLLQGEYEAAVQTLEQIDLHSAFALNALGFAHYKLHNSEAAQASLEQAAALAPQWGEPLRLQGFVAQFEGKWDEALRYYKNALALAPGDIFIHIDLGEVYDHRGEFEQAEAAWRAALDLDAPRALPTIVSFLEERSQRPDAETTAEALCAAAIDRAPEVPQLHVTYGNRLSLNGKTQEAESAFRRALALDDATARAHNGLGILHEQAGRYDDALRAYSRARDLAPDLADIHRNVGDAYLALGRTKDALDAYRQAIATDSLYAFGYLGLGMASAELDRTGDADRALRRYLELVAPEQAAGVFSNIEASFERYGRAVVTYELARMARPTARVLARLGDAYRDAWHPVLASYAYLDALVEDPDEPLARAGLDTLAEEGIVPRFTLDTETFTGTLTLANETLDDDSFYAVHSVEGVEGEVWTVELRSDAFDPYLILRDADGQLIARDDDDGEGLYAKFQVTLPRTGQYELLANTVRAGATGSYELTLTRVRPDPSDALRVYGGVLSMSSPTLDDRTPYQLHEFQGQAGDEVDVALDSDEFDPYLTLTDENGVTIARNDDGGRGLGALAQVVLPRDGPYYVVANAVKQDAAGPYTVTVFTRRRGLGAAAPAVFEAELDPSDPVIDDGSHIQVHEIRGRTGEEVEITLVSDAFDAFVILADEDDAPLAQSDDGGGGRNALLRAVLPDDGTYRIVANSAQPGETGPYLLTVRRRP